jgi:hypothetical protein
LYYTVAPFVLQAFAKNRRPSEDRAPFVSLSALSAGVVDEAVSIQKKLRNRNDTVSVAMPTTCIDNKHGFRVGEGGNPHSGLNCGWF